jgi:Mrp family chromosome partitioning ATPase
LRLDLHDDSGEEQIRRWRAESSPPMDLLVIEAPPLSTGADAALLARATDGLVIVAESLVTDRAALVESTQRARATNCRLLGIVLDRTRDRSPRWLGRLVG